MSSIDFSAFDALTFDCYGTLIDWEAGMLAALRPLLAPPEADDETLLEAFARHEAKLEAGPYLRYNDVLAGCLRGLGEEFAFAPTAGRGDTFGRSVGDWPAFPDSPDALARLKQRFKLGVITNCDDDLFAASNRSSASSSTGSSPPSRRAATSRARRTSSSPSRASTCRASGSCTWPRACSTTTSPRSRSA